MSPSRQRSTGHVGDARQLEHLLNAEAPGLMPNVHGVFIDRDMSPGTGALTDSCSSMVPPVAAPPGAKCVFVPATLNQEALEFREGRPSVGGLGAEDWRVQTMQTLVHEIEHAMFDSAALGQPPGTSAATCRRDAIEPELSELAAIMSEFPVAIRAIPAGAAATHPARIRLRDWFRHSVTNPAESIAGALTQMRCKCDCPEVEEFVKQTFRFASSSWTPAERNAFNAELRRPGWALHWPL